MRTRLSLLALASLALLASACTGWLFDYTGTKCDATNACGNGLVCYSGVCTDPTDVPEGTDAAASASDGGIPDAGSEASDAATTEDTGTEPQDAAADTGTTATPDTGTSAGKDAAATGADATGPGEDAAAPGADAAAPGEDAATASTDAAGVWPDAGASPMTDCDTSTLTDDAGVTWCTKTFPGSGALRAVWASSASNVWVVGDGQALYHWDGTVWTDLRGLSYSDGLTSRGLRAVGGIPGGIAVAGEGGLVATLLYDENQLQVIPAGTETFNAGWSVGPHGPTFFAGEHGARIKVTGASAGQRQDLPMPDAGFSAVNGTAETDVWYGQTSGEVRRNDTLLTGKPYQPPRPITGIWVRSANEVFIVSDDSGARKCDNSLASCGSASGDGTTIRASALWGTNRIGGAETWVSGTPFNTGKIYRGTVAANGTWTVAKIDEWQGARGVFGLGPDRTFIVGGKTGDNDGWILTRWK